MIEYAETKDFQVQQIESLFLSVGWSSGKYPEELTVAMKNSDSVVSAWDNGELIGLVNALSDKIMTVYFHYLLVKPEYQSKGIGKNLMERILTKYQPYARKAVIAYKSEVGFYEKCGFGPHSDKVPMFITILTTQ